MEEKSIDYIVNIFRNIYSFNNKNHKNYNYNDDVFDEIINLTQNALSIVLSNDEIINIKRIIDSEFQIYQPEGIALLDNYDHNMNWYDNIKGEVNDFYWNRYQKHLYNEGWPLNVLNTLEYNTLDKLMNYLGDPKSDEPFSRKGLVMGDVQSGKTSNYIGLICKAADAGYKVIILLTGTIESLRQQTQIRVEEGFIGYDVENRTRVGVGKGSIEETNIIPNSVTSRGSDFTGNAGDNTLLQLNDDKIPYIIITKKNPKILKKIYEILSRINLIPPANQIKTSLLIIDDEADNASINTNSRDYDPTIINSEIRRLINLFAKSNYIGFTATPFANVFIDPESEHEMLMGDLFPNDFIFSLKAPSNYFGPEKVFINNKHNTVEIIDDYNDAFPLDHKKDWCGRNLFPSLIEAINTFLIANAIRDLREGEKKNSHRSMLINVSRFIKVQEKIESIVIEIFNNILNAVRYSINLDFNEYMHNKYIKGLYDAFMKHYSHIEEINWSTIKCNIFESIKDIEIYKVPPKDKKRQLSYEKHKDTGLRTIVIGGLALSRGITLEGLTISYLYRNTSTFDVLMQMGRWFGYRNKPKDYEDLCKVWMLKDTKEYFTTITNSIIELKNDIEEMVMSKKTPREFGIRVRNESEKLGITSKSKMRTSKKYIYDSDYYGEVLETPFISISRDNLEKNMSKINDFILNNKFIMEGNNLIVESLEMNKVLKLLDKIHIHEANLYNYFEKEPIIDFIKENNYTTCTVVVIGGLGEKIEFSNLYLNTVERSFDLLDERTIRISGKHRKLSGTSDTKYGLSKDVIESLKSKDQTIKTFLIEDRDPIFLIYPLALKKSNENKLESKVINKIVDEIVKSNLIPYGYAFGFPRTKNVRKRKKNIYFINYKTNWYNAIQRKDNEEDVE